MKHLQVGLKLALVPFKRHCPCCTHDMMYCYSVCTSLITSSVISSFGARSSQSSQVVWAFSSVRKLLVFLAVNFDVPASVAIVTRVYYWPLLYT